MSHLAFSVWQVLCPPPNPARLWPRHRTMQVFLNDLLLKSGVGTLLRLELGLYELQLRGAIQSYTLRGKVLTVRWLGAIERLFHNIQPDLKLGFVVQLDTPPNTPPNTVRLYTNGELVLPSLLATQCPEFRNLHLWVRQSENHPNLVRANVFYLPARNSAFEDSQCLWLPKTLDWDLLAHCWAVELLVLGRILTLPSAP